nr:MAG TPA: hypothetical protein [Caudoviricetes sp.]DAI49465.1 MAG TPA: hypothetical protein [Caudoviricetes sp.]
MWRQWNGKNRENEYFVNGGVDFYVVFSISYKRTENFLGRVDSLTWLGSSAFS